MTMRLVSVLVFVSMTQLLQAQWRQIGPRAYTGVIAVDPTDSQTIYIEAVEIDTAINRQVTGIRKTTDGGNTWTFFGLKEGLYFYDGGIKTIIIDPHNPKMLYVGGYSPVMGVGKSTDGGQTWMRSDSGIVPDHHGFTTQTMSFDSKRRILYAWDYSSFGGCYRSLDSAKSWQRVLPDYGAFHSVVDTIITKGREAFYEEPRPQQQDAGGGKISKRCVRSTHLSKNPSKIICLQDWQRERIRLLSNSRFLFLHSPCNCEITEKKVRAKRGCVVGEQDTPGFDSPFLD